MTTKEASRTQQLRNIDEALWRQIKASAALKGQTLTEWVEELARGQLNQKPKK